MQVNLIRKKVLITGGTGSLGKIFIKRFLQSNPDVSTIVILSRDELRQTKMIRKFQGNNVLKFIIGDVRDKDKLNKEFEGIDVVIHAAAMKHLDICENNPEETYKTNVDGTLNVIEAALANKVKKVVFVSTDKAANPISVYGHSKAEAEDLIIKAASNTATDFTILRLGNIFKSRGSVFNVFKEQSSSGTLTLFDKRSTRYLIKNSTLYKSILYSIQNSFNSVIVIPKLPVFRVRDLASAYCKTCEMVELPVRKGERIHELLFSQSEIGECYEDEKYFYLLNEGCDRERIVKEFKLEKVKIKTPVSSSKGPYLSLEELDALIHKKSFKAHTS